MIQVCAPGKALLMGEYGVLFGATALSIATKQSAVCTFEEGTSLEFHALPASLGQHNYHALFKAFLQACQQQSVTIPCGRYTLDTKAFYKGSRKLGLGSSAAAIAALTKTIFFLQKINTPNMMLKTALWAHKLFAEGLGSGVDVTTCMAGETILFKPEAELPHYEAARLFFIPDIIAIDTGRSQDTKPMIKQIMSFARYHKPYMENFTKQATGLSESLLVASSIDEAISCIEDFYQRLDELSQKASLAIISDEHRTIHEMAQRYQGSAKPSGSGGGDLALALIPKFCRQDFIDALGKTGFYPVAIV